MLFYVQETFFHPDYNRRRRNFTGLCTLAKCQRALPPVGNMPKMTHPTLKIKLVYNEITGEVKSNTWHTGKKSLF